MAIEKPMPGSQVPQRVQTNSSGVTCVHVNDPMNSLVKPEIEDVLNYYPSCGDENIHPRDRPWKQQGVPSCDFVIHLDLSLIHI